MGAMLYSLSWVMQDLYHQPYFCIASSVSTVFITLYRLHGFQAVLAVFVWHRGFGELGLRSPKPYTPNALHKGWSHFSQY